MSRIFNKMYIVSGGVKATDNLSDYRFQTRKMLDVIPWSYTHALFDEAIEVDSSGKHIEYDKFHCDNYWTSCVDIELKDLTCRRVAKINGVWMTLDIDPFEDDVYDYLKDAGFEQKLGFGGGWFDKEHNPEFKQAIFTEIHQRLKLEWDFKRNRFAAIVPNMKKDELTIHTGDKPHWYNGEIGRIKLDGKTVVVEYNDDVYKFEKETDQGFIDFVNLCIKANNQVVFNHAEEKYAKPEWADKQIMKEAYMKELNKTLEDMNKHELKWKQESFKELFDAYNEVK